MSLRHPLVLPASVLLALAAAILLLPVPGSLSVRLHEAVAAAAALPGIGALTLVALGLLGALWLVVAIRLLRGRDRRRVLRFGVASAAVPLAYGASEGIKLLVAQGRPCWTSGIAADCPPPGDWSFPSNHATVAFALAAVIALAAERRVTIWLALVLAVVAAAARVLEGVHYPHDVAAGALLGVLVVSVVWWLLRPRERASSTVARQ
ncbi:phosphatase PAP2 family protein [Agromyces soli]|uniref:Phosphatase PAP2 family protein n=1 Tax=Agromyces soli TaxID=659012 RepID=A0ABY4AU55_9MICO|nr:phosphatase PAP2 family protein [Agromyces soli]UOE26404.1 phosphatase PAP2 family protein [Agromyces soli]